MDESFQPYRVCPTCKWDLLPSEELCVRCFVTTLDLTDNDDVYPTVVGHRLLMPLGEGGSAKVFLAESDHTKDLVALKLFPSRGLTVDSPELEALKRLRTEATPQLVTYSTDSDPPHIATKYIDGENFEDWRARKPSDMEVIKVLLSVCRVLNAVHLQGVIHCDLTPRNLLISSNGNVYLIDFGSAQMRDFPSSKPPGRDILHGTPGFVAPELLAGQSARASADIYSLGALIVFAFTESGAQGVDTTRVMSQGLRSIVAKCLQADPLERYESARQVAEELERVLAHFPTIAENASAFRHVRYWLSRHRLSISLGALTIFLLTVIVFSVIIREVESQSKAKAELTAQLINSADEAFRRGRWLMAEKQYREALTYQPPNPVSLEIAIWKCLLRTNRINDRWEEFLVFQQSEAAMQYQAECRLLQGEALMIGQSQQSQAKQFLMEAISCSPVLMPDDMWYARGLLADSPAESLRCFEESLRINPNHYASHTAYSSGLTLLGRLQEARNNCVIMRRHYPDDPLPDFIEFYISLSEGDEATARKHWANLFQHFPSESTDLQLEDFEIIAKMIASNRRISRTKSGTQAVDLAEQLFVVLKVEQLKARVSKQRALAIPAPCIAWWFDAAERYKEIALKSQEFQSANLRKRTAKDIDREALLKLSKEARELYPAAEFYFLESGARFHAANRLILSGQLNQGVQDLVIAADLGYKTGAKLVMFPGGIFDYQGRTLGAFSDAILLRPDFAAFAPDPDRERRLGDSLTYMALQAPSDVVRTEVFLIMLESLPATHQLRAATVWATLAPHDPEAWKALGEQEWRAKHYEAALYAAGRWEQAGANQPAHVESAAIRRRSMFRDLTIRRYDPLAAMVGPALPMSVPGVRSAVQFVPNLNSAK